jgi:hypothetical protein
MTHPRQKAIIMTIIMDLIIDCSLPLSIVKNPACQHFIAVLEPKYVNPNRTTISSKLLDITTVTESKIKEKMTAVINVSITVDIWSDRKMRRFLGITGHVLEVDSKKPIILQSYLSSCERFKESHTGKNTSVSFENVCDKYDIRSKLDSIICDNATNIKKHSLCVC